MRVLVFLLMLMPTIALADRAKVIVQPFANDDKDPIARAVQASIVADLSRAEGLTAEAGPVEADSAKAIELAKKKNARFLIIGAYHTIDAETRFTGQIMDLSNGNVIGGLKATGPMRDLFGLEDQLAQQAQRVMQATLKPAVQQPAPPPQPASPQPTRSTGTIFEGSELDRALRGEPSPYEAYEQMRRHYYYGDLYGYTPTYGYPHWSYGYGYGYGWSPYFVVRGRPTHLRFFRPIVRDPSW